MASSLRNFLSGRPARPSPPPAATPPEPLIHPPAPRPTFTQPQTIQQRHVADNARLFADRSDMVSALALPPDATIVEVGVGLGTFSEFMLRTIGLSQFVAIDSFRLHELPELWGKSTKDLFGQKTHAQWYRSALSQYADRMVVREGDSAEQLADFPDNHFDMIYLDADHTYEGVRRDGLQAVAKVKSTGFIVFNDYMLLDHGGNPYGVVQFVNELLQTGDWLVWGFSLHPLMYCDITLCHV
jgi:hypothetical protein